MYNSFYKHSVNYGYYYLISVVEFIVANVNINDNLSASSSRPVRKKKLRNSLWSTASFIIIGFDIIDS